MTPHKQDRYLRWCLSSYSWLCQGLWYSKPI